MLINPKLVLFDHLGCFESKWMVIQHDLKLNACKSGRSIMKTGLTERNQVVIFGTVHFYTLRLPILDLT